jgi:valyl-tRNA synthetase
MAKTKGNVVDPLVVMDEAGADALRFAVIHGAAPGQDQRFGPQKLETGRYFANKLWNATRYVLGARPASIAAEIPRRAPDAAALGPVERWIRSRTAATVEAVDAAIGEYQLAEVTRALYDGIWSEFCDWGLELAKVRLADTALPDATREATWWTLVESLDAFVRLLHPVMPFVTEALWASLPHAADDPDLLVVARWPAPADRDASVEAGVGAVLDLITRIRNARKAAGVPAADWLDAQVAAPGTSNALLVDLAPQVERLARVKVRVLPPENEKAEIPGALSVVAGGLEASLVPHQDPEVVARERERLGRELEQAEQRLASARARIADPAFVARAPAAIVDGARRSEAELAAQVASLRDKLTSPGSPAS